MFRPHARDPRSLRALRHACAWGRRAGRPGSLAAALMLGACDIPTALPKWDTTFVVESPGTTLTVAQLLPASMSLTENNGAFAISLSPLSFSQALGGLCAGCAALDGKDAARPSLHGTFGSSIALPADLAAATLVAGRLNVTVRNGFSFDPLHTGASAGALTITARSGATVLGSRAVTGASEMLPAGGELVTSVPLAGALDGPLLVTADVSSPAGDATPIDAAARLIVSVTPNDFRASFAMIRVQSRHITAAPIQLRLASLDRSIIGLVRAGSIILAVNNPLDVTGSLLLTIAGGKRPISKPVTIAAGDSNVEVALDASELRAFLGHDVTMTLAGNVSAPGSIAVTPQHVITVSSRLKLMLGARE